MEKAIAYMQRLEPAVQDDLARNILEDAFADLSETERREIAAKVGKAEADFQSGRFTEDSEEFWGVRLAHASRAKSA